MFDMVKLLFLNSTWCSQFNHFLSVFFKTGVFQKIIVVVYVLCFGLQASAQRNSLVIFSSDGHPFYLSINKEQINKIDEGFKTVSARGEFLQRLKGLDPKIKEN